MPSFTSSVTQTAAVDFRGGDGPIEYPSSLTEPTAGVGTASPAASPTRISEAPVGDDLDRPNSEPDSRIVETTDLAGCVGRGPRLPIQLGAPPLVAMATLLVGSGGDAVASAALRAIA